MNLANARTDVLKEPRGFIKIIQFLFSILAFACLVDWRGTLSFNYDCGTTNGTASRKGSVAVTFKYPFAMDEIQQAVPLCDKNKDRIPPGKVDFELNAVQPSQFFVFIGVVAFFASIGIAVGYVLYEDVYLSSPRYAWGDIFVHGALSFLWFVSSCAFAAHISKIKKYSSFTWVVSEGTSFVECYQKEYSVTCTLKGNNPTYANIDIAALCGFVNVFLWGANIWFLYKETRPGGGGGEGGFPNDVQDSPTAGGYEPYGPGPGMGGSVGGGGGGQWGSGQSAVQGGMNEI